MLAQAHDAIVVPVAVLGKPEADGSYNVKVSGANQQLLSRSIKIGIRNQKMAQVLAGLTPGGQGALMGTRMSRSTFAFFSPVRLCSGPTVPVAAVGLRQPAD